MSSISLFFFSLSNRPRDDSRQSEVKLPGTGCTCMKEAIATLSRADHLFFLFYFFFIFVDSIKSTFY